MAGMKSIDEARDQLEDELLRMDQTIETCLALVGEQVPPWLYTMLILFKRIDGQAQAYMGAVHQHARPVLKDVAALTRSK